tara:strand:+ start:5127 stop:5501 length:375 start_codon:yes stop_codon:yes gene_type:complete
MKYLKVLKAVFLFSVLITLFSCKDDDKNINQATDLVGEWQRSDVTIEFEYQLIFYANYSGVKTERIENSNGQGISSAVMFHWSTYEDILDLDFDGEITNTSYFINAEGQLFLSDLTNLYFIKLD